MKKFIKILVLFLTIFLSLNIVNAESNDGKIFLTKEAVKSDVTYGRDAEVTLGISSNQYETVKSIDIVLVLDRSGSMSGNKMKSTKNAANDLLDTIFTFDNDNIRVGILTFNGMIINAYSTTDFSNDVDYLKGVVNSIPNGDPSSSVAPILGTNLHEGLLASNELFKKSTSNTRRIIIMLSDGEATVYSGLDEENNKVKCWCGSYVDSVATNKNYCKIGDTNVKPSQAAILAATDIKESGIEIYTIGFGIGKTSSAFKTLQVIASDSDTNAFLANNYAQLTETFQSIFEDITLIATDAVVTDIVPAGFDVKNLPEDATKVVNADGTTTITWNIGNLYSIGDYKLTYTVEAKEEDYGSMFTNVEATLEAVPSKGNPAYQDEIDLKFPVPVVPIPSITTDDDYSKDSKNDVIQGHSIDIDLLNNILLNDKLVYEHVDKDAVVSNKIVLVEDKKLNGKLENIKLNQDGTFTFTSDADTLGKVKYKYYVETTVMIDGKETIVKSNSSIITINVVENPTKYTVNYLNKKNNEKLADSKVVDGNVFDKITEEALDIFGYRLVSDDKKSIILAENSEENVINFYYELIECEYTVNYYLKGTDKKIIPSLVIDSTLGKKIKTSSVIKDIKGYRYDSSDVDQIVVEEDATNNVINLYYVEVFGSVTVYYVDKDGNNLTDPIYMTGLVGDKYITDLKKFNNYILVEVYGKENGEFEENDLVVKYVYDFIPKTGIEERNISGIMSLVFGFILINVFKNKKNNEEEK